MGETNDLLGAITGRRDPQLAVRAKNDGNECEEPDRRVSEAREERLVIGDANTVPRAQSLDGLGVCDDVPIHGVGEGAESTVNARREPWPRGEARREAKGR